MMKMKTKTQMLNMERLGVVLKETFSELNYLDVSGDNEYFYMEFASGTKSMAKLMQMLDRLVKPLITTYGEKELSYVFNINKGKELVNIIRYNEKGYGDRISLNIGGQEQSLFIVDLLGIGDYSVFNQDFECLGIIYRPIRMPASGQYRLGKLEAFADVDGWTTSSRILKPYLSKIVRAVHEQLQVVGV
ncbi:hypothetical protein [Pedobacter ureilyticus]|uniref:Uncharacterized protein n=1 Tax=Pedobacter ureilyticus TaxID=1393051 RepID=A0ABW9J266_9SPHI|nr:hypothetical protein [Pedobacter helvus]